MPHHLKATHRCHRAIDFVDRTDGYSASPYGTKSRPAARANGSTSATPKNTISLPCDCSLRASAVMGFKCPDKGMLTKPIFIVWSSYDRDRRRPFSYECFEEVAFNGVHAPA